MLGVLLEILFNATFSALIYRNETSETEVADTASLNFGTLDKMGKYP